MTSPETVLQRDDTTDAGDLYLSFELGEQRWTLTLSDGRRSPSRHTVAAGDTAAVVECVCKAKARCRLEPAAAVPSCYEAGRDGGWLHRWLHAQGIDNIVVDSASIEVNRRARRAKTDRLDGDKLLAMLQRHRAGERVGSVLREPTPEQEDARRTHRELERLLHERIAQCREARWKHGRRMSILPGSFVPLGGRRQGHSTCFLLEVINLLPSGRGGEDAPQPSLR